MMKKQFVAPRIIQDVSIVLERNLLGSVEYTVETAGQENGGFYDTAETGSTFNHVWE